MGGFGSGRHGGGPVVEDGLTLDLDRLRRDGTFPPAEGWRQGSLVWTDTRSGARVASIGYEISLGAGEGWMRLRYTSTDPGFGEKREADYRISLTSIPTRFGGRRWYFRCPHLGLRCGRLHLPPGAFTFASRQAHRLAYRSQRATPRDRALDKALKLRRRLGSEGGVGDPVAKPKWMRWPTYERRLEQVLEADERCEEHLIMLAVNLLERHRAGTTKGRT